MKSLEKAVEILSELPAADAKKREEAVGLLEAAIKDAESAIAIWQEYLANPGEPAQAERSVVTWIGPERGKKLHAITLAAQERLKQICRLAGPPASRLATLEDDLVEAPYRQLKAGQTGPDFAKEIVGRLNERIAYLRGLIERLRHPQPMRRSA
jgi:hypothetical protein